MHITTNVTSDDLGDWMELLFVGAGRLSGVGGAGQQPDDEGGGGGINEIEWKRSNQMNFLGKPQSHPLDSSSVCCTYYSLTHILKEKNPLPRNYLQSNQISPQRFLLASFFSWNAMKIKSYEQFKSSCVLCKTLDCLLHRTTGCKI